MEVYSNSRVNTFDQCKLRYRLKYIDRAKPDIDTTIEAFMGDMVHQTLEKLYQDVDHKKTPSAEKLLEFYEKLWKQNWSEDVLVVKKEYSQDNYRKMGREFIRNFYKRFKPFNHSKTIGLETTYIVEIAKDIGYHIRIDRLALKRDVYEIHDYKTSSSLPTNEQVENDLQLSLYTYGLKKKYPVKKAKQIWHYLAFDKDVVTLKTEKQIEEAREKVLKIISEINECREYPAETSSLCPWCEFRSRCPNFKHLYQEDRVQEGGVELVDRYAELDREVKGLEKQKEKVKEKLVAFSRQHDLKKIYGTKYRASIYRYERMSFPKKKDPRRKAFFETLKKVGLWEELEIADVYELTKRINRGKVPLGAMEQLERFIEKSDYARIYLNKKN